MTCSILERGLVESIRDHTHLMETFKVVYQIKFLKLSRVFDNEWVFISNETCEGEHGRPSSPQDEMDELAWGRRGSIRTCLRRII